MDTLHVSLLERIANAVERIAASLETGHAVDSSIDTTAADAPFPWDDPRIDSRTRNTNNWRKRRWVEGARGYEYGESRRPLTFKAFLQLGRYELCRGHSVARNIGKLSIEKLDPIFEENGFGEKWKLS